MNDTDPTPTLHIELPKLVRDAAFRLVDYAKSHEMKAMVDPINDEMQNLKRLIHRAIDKEGGVLNKYRRAVIELQVQATRAKETIAKAYHRDLVDQQARRIEKLIGSLKDRTTQCSDLRRRINELERKLKE